MFSAQDIRKLVVANTLEYLGEWSQSAENLLVGTAIEESRLSLNEKTGNRLGLFRLTPSQHKSVWDDFLVQFSDKASRIRGLAGQHSFLDNPDQELVTNLRYATAIAWCIYLKAGYVQSCEYSMETLANFWQRHYSSNTSASIGSFLENYRRCYPTHAIRVA